MVSVLRRYLNMFTKAGQVSISMSPAVEQLISAYPAWTKVEDLPADQLEERMKVVGDLWVKALH
jgi:hypothetical protein